MAQAMGDMPVQPDPAKTVWDKFSRILGRVSALVTRIWKLPNPLSKLDTMDSKVEIFLRELKREMQGKLEEIKQEMSGATVKIEA